MEDFLKEGKNIMGGLFDDEEVGKFCENVCETWPSLSAVRDNVYTLSEKLWAFHGAATGETKMMLGAFLSLTHYSMSIERAV